MSRETLFKLWVCGVTLCRDQSLFKHLMLTEEFNIWISAHTEHRPFHLTDLANHNVIVLWLKISDILQLDSLCTDISEIRREICDRQTSWELMMLISGGRWALNRDTFRQIVPSGDGLYEIPCWDYQHRSSYASTLRILHTNCIITTTNTTKANIALYCVQQTTMKHMIQLIIHNSKLVTAFPPLTIKWHNVINSILPLDYYISNYQGQ